MLVENQLKMDNVVSAFIKNNEKDYYLPQYHNLFVKVLKLFFKTRMYIFLCLANKQLISRSSTKCDSRSIGVRSAVNKV